MLRPSYSELMEVLNEDTDLDSKITSRYTIVIAAAKRARQIVSGAECDVTDAATDKAVSIAISELGRGLIKLYPDGMPKELEEQAAPELRAYNPREDIDGLAAMEDFDDDAEAGYEENILDDEFDN